jgi:hypothetical protein
MFLVHLNVRTSLQIVSFSILKTVGPLSKMKPCTRRGPDIQWARKVYAAAAEK